MESRKTVITGMGSVSPFGGTTESLMESLYGRRSGVTALEDDSPLRALISYGAPCPQFTGSIEDFGELDKELKRNIRKGTKVMCRETQMAVASAQKALLDAELHFKGEPQNRVGIMYASDYMLAEPTSTFGAFRACMDEADVFHPENLGTDGLPNVTPLWLLIWLPNMPACHISIYNQLLGPSNSLTMNEAGANAALKYAHETILRGCADIIVTGATGTRLQNIRTWQVGISEKLADRDLAPESASRPFDVGHTGQVLGEGSGSLILESLEHAQARGAQIHAYFLAGADSMSGTHSSDLSRNNLVPDYRQGFENVLRRVLEQSGKSVDEIGFIHAHALGVPEVDRAEAEAIQAVFGSRSTPIPVVAAKSAFGNLGAGASAIELIAGIEAMKRGNLFPTQNFTAPDTGCELNIVTNETTPAGDCFINLNMNFTGQASAALLGKAE